MNTYDSYIKRLDVIMKMLGGALDAKTVNNAADDLAGYFLDLNRDYTSKQLADDEWISLSVHAYNVRDAIILRKLALI